MADGPPADTDLSPNDPPYQPMGDFPGRPGEPDPRGGSVLRGIDWRAAFPVVHLFRGFRVAIHPSKLLLALVAVLLIYTVGRCLDGVWLDKYQAYPGEVEAFGTAAANGDLRAYGAARERLRFEARDAYDALRRRAAAANPGQKPVVGLGEVRAYIVKQRTAAVAAANKKYAAAKAAQKDKKAAADKAGKAAAEDVAEDQIDRSEVLRKAEVAAAYRTAEVQYRQVEFVNGRGLFITLYEYEADQLNGAAASVLAFDPFYAAGAALRFVFIGPLWMMVAHPLYFVLFFTLALVTVAIFGGAISRIAAVHVARDERISVRQSLKFSAAKFLSFVSAPLIPAVVFIGVGVAVGVCGLLLYIPYVGPIAVGIFFFVALLAGLLMTLILIGTLGGFGLMYPTIAAEGSDSFDAISRSFSYLFARPWRFIFYTLVALVYGALTFLFVKLFLYLVIRLALLATGLFVVRTAADGSGLLTAMAAGPANPLDLSYEVPFITLNGAQHVAAFFLAFWIYLVVGLAAAFVLSMYFSLNTIIYFLMRSEVDATDPDEVYLEPGEDEFADTIDPLEPAESTEPNEPLAASQSEATETKQAVEVGPEPADNPAEPDVPQVEPGEPMADRTTDAEPADADDSTPVVDPEAPKED